MRIRLQTISARPVFAPLALALTICLLVSSLSAFNIHTALHGRLMPSPESSPVAAHVVAANIGHRGSGRLMNELAYRGSGRLSNSVAHRGSGRLTYDLAYRGSGRLTQQTA